MEQGNLAEWLVKEGDSFSPGDVLARIETDKATVDFEAQDDGIVAKILIPAGTNDISVGEDIMVTVEDEDDVGAFASFDPSSAGATEAPEPAAPEPPVAAPAAPASVPSNYPSHRMEGLPALSPTMEQGNLAEWLVKEVDSFSPGDVLARIETDKVSVNDFVLKASGCALKSVPAVNAQWGSDAIRYLDNVDICVAVATDGGLLTPIVTDVPGRGLTSISGAVKELAGRARDGTLKPEEMVGGTFTVSNLGMFGVSHFTSIINPPQVGILAVGGTIPRILPGEPNDEGEPTFRQAQVMTVTLSCDHRVVDGAIGAKWLQAFKGYIEDPLKMIL